MKNDEKYQQVKQRVRKLKGFYSHLTTYGSVMTLLFFIDLLTGGIWWFFWPLFGWGVGVSAHALSVFGRSGFLNSEWEQKKIDELMQKTE